MKNKIHFIRHGSVANPENILYGRLADFALSSKGIAEARLTGKRLSGNRLTAIYASPMLRAQQTAKEISAFHNGVSVVTAEELNEVLTPYQGRKADELIHLNEDFYTGTRSPYEQPEDIVKRALIFIRSVRENNSGGEVAAVTHGDIISFLILNLRGLDVVPGNKARLTMAGIKDKYPGPASITTLTFQSTDEFEIPAMDYFLP
jgi:broad specificity phosphatase PhoE